MENETQAVDRRDLLRLGSAALAGAAALELLTPQKAEACTGPRPAINPLTFALGRRDGGRVKLVSIGYETFQAPLGKKCGICLVLGKRQPQRGRRTIPIELVALSLRSVDPINLIGDPIAGFAEWRRDMNVEVATRKVLPGLNAPPAARLFGLSAEINADVQGGQPAAICWQVSGVDGNEFYLTELRDALGGFIAFVTGKVRNASFEGHMSYSESELVSSPG